MKVVVTTAAIRRAKLQSNHQRQQSNIQRFTDRTTFLSTLSDNSNLFRQSSSVEVNLYSQNDVRIGLGNHNKTTNLSVHNCKVRYRKVKARPYQSPKNSVKAVNENEKKWLNAVSPNFVDVTTLVWDWLQVQKVKITGPESAYLCMPIASPRFIDIH